MPTNKDAIKQQDNFVFLVNKDNGGLFIPNEDLIEICKLTVMKVRRMVPSGLEPLNKTGLLRNVLRYTNKPSIFTNLRTLDRTNHGLDDDHVLKLIKLIIEEYLKVRLHYLAKEETLNLKPVTNRNTCTKLVHFKGN